MNTPGKWSKSLTSSIAAITSTPLPSSIAARSNPPASLNAESIVTTIMMIIMDMITALTVTLIERYNLKRKAMVLELRLANREIIADKTKMIEIESVRVN